MSGTWVVVWPSGKVYSFHRSLDAANIAAHHASRVQVCRMGVALWG